MSYASRTLVVVALLGTVALGACQHDPNAPKDYNPGDYALVDTTANLTLTDPSYTPIYTPISLTHPWVGRKVKIRDYTGDGFDRCLGVGQGGSGSQLQAEFCYSAPNDGAQLWDVVDASSATSGNWDPSAVVLRNVVLSTLCVDIRGGTANGGEVVQLYPCHYGTSQKLHLPTPSSGATGVTGPILTKASSYKMALEADAPSRYVTVKPVWQRLFSSSNLYQRWTLNVY